MTLLFYRILSFFERSTVKSPPFARHDHLATQGNALEHVLRGFMGRASMESNPKFAIDLDDFESRLAQAIENERPAPLSIPSQSSTNATMGIPAPTAKLRSTIRRRSNLAQIVPSRNRPTSIGSGPCRAIRDGHPVDGLQLGDLPRPLEDDRRSNESFALEGDPTQPLCFVLDWIDWSFDGTNSQKFAATTMANAADFESQCWSH